LKRVIQKAVTEIVPVRRNLAKAHLTLSFHKYSAYYDLLYADKDYQAEAEYVAGRLRGANGQVRSILELGSGTGRHGRLLAAMGFDVYGVEKSSEMASNARPVEAKTDKPGSFTCEVGDLREVRTRRTFDAVISLFHVMSYQTTNEDLAAAFKTAAEHLERGGLFLFDVWHGPAVLATPPSVRTKEAANQRYHVKRVARPEISIDSATVKVFYKLDCEDAQTGNRVQFNEEHVLRYLFPDEIEEIGKAAGFTLVATEEFLTSRTPTTDTWGVCYLLKKQ
jgi:SAM-dependent methyltransferase